MISSLKLFALGLAPAGLLQACTRGARPARASLGSLLAVSQTLAADGVNTVFSHYDIDGDELHEIPVPLDMGHVAIPHPSRARHVVLLESAGEKACVVDLESREVQKKFSPAPGRLFGGHGVFSPDGKIFYASEFETLPSGKGFIAVRDADTFRILRSFPSEGRFPHDVSITENGHLLVANLGAETGPLVKASGIFACRFELGTEKLVSRTELAENPAEVDGSPKKGTSSIARDDDEMKTDARYFIDYVSLAHPDQPLFAYPHPHRKVVILWELSTKKSLKEFPFPEQPVALTRIKDAPLIAVTFASGKIRMINLKTLEIDDSVKFSKPLKTNAHLHWMKA